jgi:DNA-binding transcriptional ArsR family regulator
MRVHGLLEAERDGQRVYYRVIHPAARTVIGCIRDHCTV